MKLSVVIPARNERRTIGKLLDSLCAQNRPADEIIVVDNGSSDKTAGFVKNNYPNVRVLFEEKPGAVFARERGFAEARGEVLCRTDADCKAPPDWLSVIERYFLQHPHTVAITGPIVYMEKPARFFGAVPAYFFSYLFWVF